MLLRALCLWWRQRNKKRLQARFAALIYEWFLFCNKCILFIKFEKLLSKLIWMVLIKRDAMIRNASRIYSPSEIEPQNMMNEISKSAK
jgi:hypothetical protein